MLKEHVIPYDLDAERAVLSCMFLDSFAVDIVSPLLEADAFYRSLHADIYRAMCRMHDAGESIDLYTLNHVLGEQKDTFAFLTELYDVFAIPGNTEQYARIVANTYKQRQLMKKGAEIVADAATTPDVNALITDAEQQIAEIGKQRQGAAWQSLSSISVDYLEQFLQLESRRGEISGLATGFRALDFYLAGMQKKNMVVVAGRPGTGKTSFALSIAHHVAFKDNKKVAFFSLEMSKEELFGRLVSMRAMIDGRQLRTPWMLSAEEKQRAHQAIADLDDTRIFIDDTQAISTADFRNNARRLYAEHHGIDLIIVDYLQLMRATIDGKRIRERHNEIAEVSMAIKALAKELDVPILALAQLNREVESRQSKVPQMSDLRESGQIEQDSDVIMFLYAEEIYNPNTDRKGQTDIIIAKHRHGPTGEVTLHFEQKYTQFTNMETRS